MIAAKLDLTCWNFADRFLLAVAVFILLAPASGGAQAIPAGSSTPPWSRVEFYGGFAYLNSPNSTTSSYKIQPQAPGSSFSGTAYFNHYFGIQGQFDLFPSASYGSILRTQAGTVFRFPVGRFVPSIHVLGGMARASGPQYQPESWGAAATAGAVVDYVLPRFSKHLSLRLVQADFDYSHITYGPSESARVTGFLSQLSAGVVYRGGETETRRTIQMGCTADKVEVFAGEPITITAHVQGEDPKRTIDFRWISTGGQLEGTGDVVRLDTQALSPGDYVVTGTVHQRKNANAAARCISEFRVLQFQPPTLTCSANPTLIVQGGSIAIHAVAHSPQNRPLNYGYDASPGVVTGSGADVTLATFGMPPGDLQIACEVTDDVSHTVTAKVAIRIVPIGGSKPKQLAPLCALAFDSEAQTATQVNEPARNCLDQIAAALLEQPVMNLILLAKHSEDEVPDIAALRALNTAEYLIHERKVDPNRIKLLSGGGYGRQVDSYLLKKNEIFLPGDAATIDSSSLARHAVLYSRPSSRPDSTKPQP